MHVIVVDPGVGSDRAIVALEMMGHIFLASDLPEFIEKLRW